MSFFNKLANNILPEAAKEKIIKNKIKSTVKKNIGENEKIEQYVDDVADKIINKVGASNILKAKDIFDDLKQKK